MYYHLGQQFSTKDQDNDASTSNCVNRFSGAWWHKDCHLANLNGRYLNGATNQYSTGVTWKPWRGQYFSLIKTEMKLRSIQACK